MTRQEMIQILARIDATFPAWKPKDLNLTVDVWLESLGGYEYEKVLCAVKTYIMSDTTGFAPSIGQINNLICTIEERTTETELNEMQAWALVSTALRNGTYGAEEEYGKLPPLVQKAVGSPQNLHNWATSDYSTIETVIMSNFQRTYRTMLTRDKENRRMPYEVQKLIALTENNNPYLLEGGGTTE